MGYFEDVGERRMVDEFNAFIEAVGFEGVCNIWVDLYVLGTAFHLYQQY